MKKPQTVLFNICRYIAENDRNSDIMDMYEEYLGEEVPEWVVFECVKQVISDWKEDIEINGATEREKQIFAFLGL